MEENNYLWDRTGEVDPEIRKLEEVLGTLRYQPRSLRIPPNIQIGRRRNFFPAPAIAAAIALLAVALGIWFSFNRRHRASQSFQAKTASQNTSKSADDQQQFPLDNSRGASIPTVRKGPQTAGLPAKEEGDVKPTHNRNRQRNLVAVNRTRAPRTNISPPELTPQELADKEQMLLALRLVSVKLNLAQRKAQGGAPLNVIRNQHRIG